ncbi:MAG: hypothetical protein ACREXY_27945 [Gammaproteobacteria bacterium]
MMISRKKLGRQFESGMYHAIQAQCSQPNRDQVLQGFSTTSERDRVCNFCKLCKFGHFEKNGILDENFTAAAWHGNLFITGTGDDPRSGLLDQVSPRILDLLDRRFWIDESTITFSGAKPAYPGAQHQGKR